MKYLSRPQVKLLILFLVRRFDLNFWYSSGFGSPVGRAQGIGYVQELVARLTQTPIKTVRRDPFSSPLLLTTMHFCSTIRPLTRRWTATRLPSPWTVALFTLTQHMKSLSSMVYLFSFKLCPLRHSHLHHPVLTALNLSTLAATGPLPYDHIPQERSFITHEVAAFGTNVQFQRMPPPPPLISSASFPQITNFLIFQSYRVLLLPVNRFA